VPTVGGLEARLPDERQSREGPGSAPGTDAAPAELRIRIARLEERLAAAGRERELLREALAMCREHARTADARAERLEAALVADRLDEARMAAELEAARAEARRPVLLRLLGALRRRTRPDG
jgi:uncharacterized membrane protein